MNSPDTLRNSTTVTVLIKILFSKISDFFYLMMPTKIYLQVLIVIWIISYCTKRAKFEDDHVFQDEELPKVYYRADDPSIASRPKIHKPDKVCFT